jgi:hypothetical protein
LLLPARGTNISFSALVLVQSADGHAGVFEIENFAHVLGDKPRFAVLYDRSDGAVIEPEFGW